MISILLAAAILVLLWNRRANAFFAANERDPVGKGLPYTSWPQQPDGAGGGQLAGPEPGT